MNEELRKLLKDVLIELSGLKEWLIEAEYCDCSDLGCLFGQDEKLIERITVMLDDKENGKDVINDDLARRMQRFIKSLKNILLYDESLEGKTGIHLAICSLLDMYGLK